MRRAARLRSPKGPIALIAAVALAGAGLACDARSSDEQTQDMLQEKQNEINRDLDKVDQDFKRKMRESQKEAEPEVEKLLRNEGK